MKNFETRFIFPSEMCVVKEPHIISTVLGSCVSVCIFDRELKYGGMNHYMLPFWNGIGLESPKYGNIANEKLLRQMLVSGSRKSNLITKIFGGASMLNSSSEKFNIGARNIELAFEMLTESEIPIVASSTGGVRGRKIYFNTQTGEVMQKYIPSNHK